MSGNPNMARHMAPQWIAETRGEASAELKAMKHALQATLNALASDLAGKSRNGDVASITEIQDAAGAFLGTLRRLMTRLSERLGDGLHERVRPYSHLEPLGSELAKWEASIKSHEVTYTQYVSGWIEGGGLALALMMRLPTDRMADAKPYRDVLQEKMSFVVDRAEAAVAMWLDEVDRGLTNAVAQLDPIEVTTPAAPRTSDRARLDELLARAAALKVRIRNVPSEPSARYLGKLEAQLGQIERKRQQHQSAQRARQSRLSDLMRFAQTLKMRPRDVPADPSEAWLDRMEAKLTEVARQRNVPLPASIEPPTAIENAKTLNPPPDRDMVPDARRSVRIQSLLDRAHSVGLDIGTIPPNPNDRWVADMEGKLQQALEERRSRRLAMRQRRESEQDQRLDRIRAQSRELGVELGPVPEPLTEEWLTGAELAMAGALMESEARRSPSSRAAQTPGEVRLSTVLNLAATLGVDLGIIPPEPDTVWLTWAETRVEQAQADDDVAIEAEGPDVPHAYLVYEEGTVQEQLWPIGRESVTIGRARGNDVQIQNDPAVSRRHAALRVHAGQYVISDLGSTKGTIVDNQRIVQERPLQDGARIQVGDTDFVFRLRVTL